MKFRFPVAFCIFSISLIFGPLKSAAAVEWRLVADGNEKMPLKEVLYLLGSDASDRLTVVGTVHNIPDVAKVTFEAAEVSGISSPVVDSDVTALVCADNYITVYGLDRDAELDIYSADGRLVLSVPVGASGSPVSVSVSGLRAGVYVASLLDRSVKILKK